MDKDKNPAIKRYSLFPKPFAASAEPVLKPIYKKYGFAEHRILTKWAEIVGAELAACCIPQKLTLGNRKTGGTLHVLVASGRALELQHMQPLILKRIAVYFGSSVVQKITCMQTSSALLRKQPPASRSKPCVPSETICEITSSCADEALRNALISLGTAMKFNN
ncbi:MAG TPA: DUF721 domain-containing protein [Rickettsiales bacterium]|nr:DUF721 domain-containing protein [Rickettsiales bacterium]